MPSQTLQADLLATAPLRDSFVRPFYLSLLGGRFTRTDARGGEGFAKRIEEAACAISDDQIERLLGQEEWRGRLAAAWFVGLSKRSKFVRRIADLLISSEVTYAGQGYCIALGLIGNDECVDGLRSYLAKFLPLNGRFYDQDWALGALALITGSPPEEFLDPALWVFDQNLSMKPLEGVRRVNEIAHYLRQRRIIATDVPLLCN